GGADGGLRRRGDGAGAAAGGGAHGGVRRDQEADERGGGGGPARSPPGSGAGEPGPHRRRGGLRRGAGGVLREAQGAVPGGRVGRGPVDAEAVSSSAADRAERLRARGSPARRGSHTIEPDRRRDCHRPRSWYLVPRVVPSRRRKGA